jgi:hypothetical protein
MIRYMGWEQPARPYPIPSESHLTSELACKLCRTRVWTPQLFRDLQECPHNQSTYSKEYEVNTADLRRSIVAEGCKWCRTVADGIYGITYLDRMYEQWNQTDSWPESGSDAADSDLSEYNERETEPELPEVEGRAYDSEKDNPTKDEESAQHDSLELVASFETNEDILLLDCTFTVQLEFERNDYQLFATMDVHVEACQKINDKDLCILHKLQGDKAVELQYHINAASKSAILRTILLP